MADIRIARLDALDLVPVVGIDELIDVKIKPFMLPTYPHVTFHTPPPLPSFPFSFLHQKKKEKEKEKLFITSHKGDLELGAIDE